MNILYKVDLTNVRLFLLANPEQERCYIGAILNKKLGNYYLGNTGGYDISVDVLNREALLDVAVQYKDCCFELLNQDYVAGLYERNEPITLYSRAASLSDNDVVHFLTVKRF